MCLALQHRPEDVDKRAADMYSFAVILWEIATNKVPFAGLSPMNIGIKVYIQSKLIDVVNPRRACAARVTVVVVCVCH